MILVIASRFDGFAQKFTLPVALVRQYWHLNSEIRQILVNTFSAFDVQIKKELDIRCVHHFGSAADSRRSIVLSTLHVVSLSAFKITS